MNLFVSTTLLAIIGAVCIGIWGDSALLAVGVYFCIAAAGNWQ